MHIITRKRLNDFAKMHPDCAARLGFAVATALDPDVLILDEVLAVGDRSFRHKCYQRIDSLRSRAAIIFVSHNMPDVGRICQSTVVMERGHTILWN